MNDEFREWLNEEYRVAAGEAHESHKAAMNSYGAGYDAGYAAALRAVLERQEED